MLRMGVDVVVVDKCVVLDGGGDVVYGCSDEYAGINEVGEVPHIAVLVRYFDAHTDILPDVFLDAVQRLQKAILYGLRECLVFLNLTHHFLYGFRWGGHIVLKVVEAGADRLLATVK